MLLPTAQISLVPCVWKMLMKERKKGKEERKKKRMEGKEGEKEGEEKEKLKNIWRIFIHSSSERVLRTSFHHTNIGIFLNSSCPPTLPTHWQC